MTGAAIVVTIDNGGLARFVYDDDAADIMAEGASKIARASHVEPADGGWTADLSPVNGPVLGPFTTRRAALDAEVAWLRVHVLGCAL